MIKFNYKEVIKYGTIFSKEKLSEKKEGEIDIQQKTINLNSITNINKIYNYQYRVNLPYNKYFCDNNGRNGISPINNSDKYYVICYNNNKSFIIIKDLSLINDLPSDLKNKIKYKFKRKYMACRGGLLEDDELFAQYNEFTELLVILRICEVCYDKKLKDLKVLDKINNLEK